MGTEQTQTVAYVSRALLRSAPSRVRLVALVTALERSGASVHLDLERQRLDFSFSCSQERWILLGRLAELLERFADIATWDSMFQERWGVQGPTPSVSGGLA